MRVLDALKDLPTDPAYDLVVVGAGGAGMAAALFAALDSKKVLLVESTGFVGGTTALDEHGIGTGADVRWITEPGNNPRLKPGFYTSENLRSISDR